MADEGLNDPKDQFRLAIVQLLQLDQSTGLSVAERLIIGGRQSLKSLEDEIQQNILNQQLNNNRSDELLKILERSTEYDWENSIREPCFIGFLRRHKAQFPDSYGKVLQRAAEYGINAFEDNSLEDNSPKDNPLLSLILQFFFTVDPNVINDRQFMRSVWTVVVSEGASSLSKYQESIDPTILTDQLNNEQSAFHFALREYFRSPLEEMFTKARINDREVFNTALRCLVWQGWWNGLNDQSVADEIARRKYEELIRILDEYMQTNHIPRPIPTPEPPPPEPLTPEIPTLNERETLLPYLNHTKLTVSDLIQAGELMYINEDLNEVLEKIFNDYITTQDFRSFINACHIHMMYLLKRHQSLTVFMNKLSYKYSLLEASLKKLPLSLRMILHLLLCYSDESLSRKIMSLLSQRNPVPFLQPSFTTDLESRPLVSDVFYTWNYSMPTILSFGIGPCQGKSTLLNDMFLSSFESSMESIYFTKTIDIDFGYCCERKSNIADVHGPISKSLFQEIHRFFDGFLIHIEYSYFTNNTVAINDFLTVLPQDSRYQLVLIRDAPPDQKTHCTNLLSRNYPRLGHTVILSNVSDRRNQGNNYSLIELRQKLWTDMPQQCRYTKAQLQTQLQTLMTENYRRALNEMFDTIKPLGDALSQTAENEDLAKQFYPEYHQFAELCKLKLKLIRFSFYGDDNGSNIYEDRQKIFALENLRSQVNKTRPISYIYELFSKILAIPNLLTCLELLRQELKQLRERHVTNAELAKELPVQKNFSLEILWRNAIVSSQYHLETLQKDLQQKYANYVQAGFPFEILDGDNFFLNYSFLSEAFKSFHGKKTLVISVLGPQNSGKSTLLNYMFGTLFDVRDGRCTRGIYGSFVKSNRTDYDNIMLIDTEGLFGIERTDPQYDRRIVLFCLAVSHIVILNMVGEVTTSLQEVFKFCVNSLNKIGVTTIPCPTVHFILNQKANFDRENNRTAIETILTDLRSSDSEQSIVINENNFHILPSAFKWENLTSTSRVKVPRISQTAPEFLDEVHNVSGEILPSTERKGLSDPLHWLNSARTVYETLEKFPDLTRYQDIHERSLETQVRKHIQNYLTKVFSEDYREDLFSQSSDKDERQITDLFFREREFVTNTAMRNFNELVLKLGAPIKVRERTQDFLRAQIISTLQAIKISAIDRNQAQKLKSIIQQGEGGFQDLIDRTIQLGRVLSHDEAKRIFDRHFQKRIQSIETTFVVETRLEQSINHIYMNYNIYEFECLISFNYILKHREILAELNQSQLSMEEVKQKLLPHFTYYAYVENREREENENNQNSLFIDDLFNPKDFYSLNIIHNLSYLRKDLLQRTFKEFYPTIEGAAPENNTDAFQKQIRSEIQHQRPMVLSKTQIRDQNLYFSIEKIFNEVIERVRESMRGVDENEPRQIHMELIQKTVGLINSLINDIDNELSPFCLRLSLPLKSSFHTCALIFLAKYYYNEQKKHLQLILDELRNKEEELREYFIARVTPNPKIDQNFAKNFGKQLKEYFVKIFKESGQNLINETMKSSRYLNRKWIQDRIDEDLPKQTQPKWFLNYIKNPREMIVDYFNKKWEGIKSDLDEKLTNEKSKYVNLLKEFFSRIEKLSTTVEGLGDATKFVNLVFSPVGTETSNISQHLNNKKRCMALLFYEYFTEKNISSTFVVNSITYQLRNDVQDFFQHRIEDHRISEDLSKIIKEFSKNHEKISIENFLIFLQTLAEKNETSRLIQEFSQIKSDFKSVDSEDNYGKLLDKVRGCPHQCPCCKRPCDFDHSEIQSKPGSKDNEHRCLSGHALRAMNGYKFEVTGEPSLFMCEQILNDYVIVLDRIRYKWSDFKKKHPDWIFDSLSTETELNRLHGKFLTIWKQIGQQLCQQYGMKYVENNTYQQVHEPFHYILLLDSSASMIDDRWTNLKAAVQKFIDCRQEVCKKDRITIIVFADEAKVAYFNVCMNDVQVRTFQFLDAATSFSAAFSCLTDCIRSAKEKEPTLPIHNNIAIVFMSDGEENYPEYELNRLLSLYRPIIKRFWTLALGDEDQHFLPTGDLRRINETMGGSFYDLKQSTALIQTYAEVATTAGSV